MVEQAPGAQRRSQAARGRPLKWHDRILLGVFALSVLFLLWQIDTTVRTKLPIYTSLKEHENMSETTTWRWLNPATGQKESKTWTTVFRDANHPSETVSEFRARHQAEVDTQWETYPPSFS